MPDLETPVADPNLDANSDFDADDEAPPEGHEDFARHLDYAMKNHPALKYMCGQHKKYEADAAGGPGVDDPLGGDVPPVIPPMDDDPNMPLRNQRGGKKGDVQKTKYQRDMEAVQAELAIARQEKKMLRYEKALTELREEGYDFEVNTELEDVLPLDDKGFEKHLNRIRRSYSRTPVGGDLPLDAIFDTSTGTADLNDPVVGQKIFRYMRENPEMAIKYGEKAYKETAKVLGLIK